MFMYLRDSCHFFFAFLLLFHPLHVSSNSTEITAGMSMNFILQDRRVHATDQLVAASILIHLLHPRVLRPRGVTMVVIPPSS